MATVPDLLYASLFPETAKHFLMAMTMLFLSGACTAESPKAAVGPDLSEATSTITLRGVIDDNMVASFKSQLTDSTKVVAISSAGGKNKDALELAELVSQRGLTVEVKDICASSCAHLIFIAGHRRVVDSGAIVVFHNTVRSMIVLGETLGVSAPDDFLPQFRLLQDREEQLYRASGVSTQLLVDPEAAMLPICMSFRRAAGEKLQWAVVRVYRGWVPTRDYLLRAGVTFDGFWPSSQESVERLVQRFSASDASYIRYGLVNHLATPVPDLPLEDRPFVACPTHPQR